MEEWILYYNKQKPTPPATQSGRTVNLYDDNGGAGRVSEAMRYIILHSPRYEKTHFKKISFMKRIWFSLLLIFNFAFFKNDQKPITKDLKKIFVSLSRHTESIYLADTIDASLTFDYAELKTQVQAKDTALLKAMIDSGSKEVINPYTIQRLLLPYKVRILTRNEFSDVTFLGMIKI